MTEPPSLLDFVEWDVRNWSVALDFWLAHSTQQLSGCAALEVGSRNGGLSLWMALQGANVICSDINGPSQSAVLKHRAYGVSHLVEYQVVDGTDIPYKEQFDVILVKSVLGGIGTCGGKELQGKAIKEMHKALRKDGELFFAENLIASPMHRCFRQKCVKWGAKWRYVSIEEMAEFLSPFSQVRFRTLGFAGALGRSEAQRNWLGLFDQVLLDHLLPNRWKYILVGVAKK